MFTARETEFLRLFCQGKTVPEMAKAMGCNQKTLAVHKVNIKTTLAEQRKFHPKNDVQLYQWAVRNFEHWSNQNT